MSTSGDLEDFIRAVWGMVSDAPERLLAAGEREQAHRHRIDERLLEIDECSRARFYAGHKRAHFVALVLGMAYLAVMALAIIEGKQVADIGLAATGLAALVWAAGRSGPSEPPLPASPQDAEAADRPESTSPSS